MTPVSRSPVESTEPLYCLSAAALSDLCRRREISPVEIVESFLSRIESINDQINAVIYVAENEALYASRSLERALARGEDPGPLAGVPFGVKDVIATSGILTTGGSRLFETNVPDRDATIVARLKHAGAIVVAKLNTMEFNYGDEADTPFGLVKNPWDRDCYAGGSSSGSAAAVAARMMPLAIGEDTGGSIRIPCANCGIVGLKPTFGRVPRTGTMGIAWSMDHVGPMTHDVRDAALALSVIAGGDTGDPLSSWRPVPEYQRELDGTVNGIRIGVPQEWFFDDIDPEVERAVTSAVEQLADHGAEIRPVSVPALALSLTVAWIVWGAEFTSMLEAYRAGLDQMGESTRDRLIQGEFWSAQDYLRAQRVRHLMQLECEEAFHAVDVIITPGAPSVAGQFVDGVPMVRIGDSLRPWIEESARSTAAFNLTGMPAIVVPCGFDSQNLPVGLQIAAPPHRDGLALRVADAYLSLSDTLKVPPI